MENFPAEELLVPVFKNGKQVYALPTIEEIRAHCMTSLDSIWEEVKRFDNPHNYYVDLSQKLWDLKYNMIKEQRKGSGKA
jgi:nicotinate phosphoribosyltransferase